WDSSDHTGRITKKLVERFLYPGMRHHLAGDFAETRLAIGNSNETVGVNHGDITRDIPTVSQHFCRLQAREGQGGAFKPRRSSPQPSGRGAEAPRAVEKAV